MSREADKEDDDTIHLYECESDASQSGLFENWAGLDPKERAELNRIAEEAGKEIDDRIRRISAIRRRPIIFV